MTFDDEKVDADGQPLLGGQEAFRDALTDVRPRAGSIALPGIQEQVRHGSKIDQFLAAVLDRHRGDQGIRKQDHDDRLPAAEADALRAVCTDEHPEARVTDRVHAESTDGDADLERLFVSVGTAAARLGIE